MLTSISMSVIDERLSRLVVHPSGRRRMIWTSINVYLALYDICNAFPTIAHAWLFAVFHCVRLNPRIVNIIRCLYSNSSAFSFGLGSGEFLFLVLAGVRTGCPLSATLFLLAMNPFLALIHPLSDASKVSYSCLCADDIGSALRAMNLFKT